MALIFHFEGYTGWTSKLKVQLNLAFEINCLALKKLKLSGFLKFLYRVKALSFTFVGTHTFVLELLQRDTVLPSQNGMKGFLLAWPQATWAGRELLILNLKFRTFH